MSNQPLYEEISNVQPKSPLAQLKAAWRLRGRGADPHPAAPCCQAAVEKDKVTAEPAAGWTPPAPLPFAGLSPAPPRPS